MENITVYMHIFILSKNSVQYILNMKVLEYFLLFYNKVQLKARLICVLGQNCPDDNVLIEKETPTPILPGAFYNSVGIHRTSGHSLLTMILSNRKHAFHKLSGHEA